MAIGLSIGVFASNAVAGIMILLNKPFVVGNMITAAGQTGVVEKIELFSTILTTADNQVVVVPNGQIANATLVNITKSDTRRVDLTFRVPFGTNVELVKQTALACLDKCPLILRDPAPTVRLHEQGESWLIFVCRPWCNTGDYWSVHWFVHEQLGGALGAVGIVMPMQTRDVNMVEAKALPPSHAADGITGDDEPDAGATIAATASLVDASTSPKTTKKSKKEKK